MKEKHITRITIDLVAPCESNGHDIDDTLIELAILHRLEELVEDLLGSRDVTERVRLKVSRTLYSEATSHQ